MKRHLSNGFIIVGIALSLLWGGTAILHFFIFAPLEISGTGEWIKSLVEIQNQMALDAYVFSAFSILLGAGVFLTLTKRLKPEVKVPQLAHDLVGAGIFAIAIWIAIALINMVLFGKTNPDMLLTESEYNLALFELLFQLTVVNYVLTFVLFIIGGIFGRAIIKKLWPDLEFISRLQEYLFSTVTGLGCIAIAIFIAGLVHLLYPWMVALILFGALVFGLEGAPSFPVDMWRAIMSIRLPGLAGGLFVVLLLMIASSLHAPLFPPFMHDAMNSHLEGPKVFIREHAINFHAYINFNNFPLGTELLYIPALMLGRVLMTQIATFLFFLMGIGAVYEFGRVYCKSPITGMLSAILLYLIPRYVSQYNHTTIDITLTVYIFLTALALAGWLYAGREKYLHLTGLILGISLGVKYLALPFLLIFVFWILVQRLLLENAGLRLTAKKIGLMLLITVIVACPWYVRNIVLFGNPFFPFYQEFFGKVLPIGTLSELKPKLQISEQEMLERYRYEGGWGRIFTFLSDISFTDIAGTTKNQMGPLYIAILPLLALVFLSGLGKLFGKYVLKWPIELDYNLPAWMCFTVVIAYMAYWIYQVGVLQVRYIFPVMPFMALLAGFTLSFLFKLDKVNGRHALAVFMLGCMGMLAILYFNQGVQRYKISELPIRQTSREAFLSRYISSYEAVNYLNTFLGPDDIVYGLLCENCRYYANFTLIGGLYGYADHHEFNRHTGTGLELYEHLKSFNCSYLMVDTKRQQLIAGHYGSIMLPRDPSFNKHFHHVERRGSTDIYEITD